MSAGGDEATSVSTHEVTRLLQAWGIGDETALEQLMPYNELHRLAHRGQGSYPQARRGTFLLYSGDSTRNPAIRTEGLESLDPVRLGYE
jgi:hypothetical protein